MRRKWPLPIIRTCQHTQVQSVSIRKLQFGVHTTEKTAKLWSAEQSMKSQINNTIRAAFEFTASGLCQICDGTLGYFKPQRNINTAYYPKKVLKSTIKLNLNTNSTDNTAKYRHVIVVRSWSICLSIYCQFSRQIWHRSLPIFVDLLRSHLKIVALSWSIVIEPASMATGKYQSRPN